MEAQAILPDPRHLAALPVEADLVCRARRGDAPAREQLATLHRSSAYVLALQLLGNREDALDVTQDAMLRFFTTLHRFDVQRPVRPWLLRIVRNRAQDLHRRRRVRRHESLEEIDVEGVVREQAIDLTVDLERDLAFAQLRRRLWRALGALPRQQREIVVLRDYQELSYAEIAERLAIPLGTVMSRLHAARKRLRELCEVVGKSERRAWAG